MRFFLSGPITTSTAAPPITAVLPLAGRNKTSPSPLYQPLLLPLPSLLYSLWLAGTRPVPVPCTNLYCCPSHHCCTPSGWQEQDQSQSPVPTSTAAPPITAVLPLAGRNKTSPSPLYQPLLLPLPSLLYSLWLAGTRPVPVPCTNLYCCPSHHCCTPSGWQEQDQSQSPVPTSTAAPPITAVLPLAGRNKTSPSPSPCTNLYCCPSHHCCTPSGWQEQDQSQSPVPTSTAAPPITAVLPLAGRNKTSPSPLYQPLLLPLPSLLYSLWLSGTRPVPVPCTNLYCCPSHHCCTPSGCQEQDQSQSPVPTSTAAPPINAVLPLAGRNKTSPSPLYQPLLLPLPSLLYCLWLSGTRPAPVPCTNLYCCPSHHCCTPSGWQEQDQSQSPVPTSTAAPPITAVLPLAVRNKTSPSPLYQPLLLPLPSMLYSLWLSGTRPVPVPCTNLYCCPSHHCCTPSGWQEQDQSQFPVPTSTAAPPITAVLPLAGRNKTSPSPLYQPLLLPLPSLLYSLWLSGTRPVPVPCTNLYCCPSHHCCTPSGCQEQDQSQFPVPTSTAAPPITAVLPLAVRNKNQSQSPVPTSTAAPPITAVLPLAVRNKTSPSPLYQPLLLPLPSLLYSPWLAGTRPVPVTCLGQDQPLSWHQPLLLSNYFCSLSFFQVSIAVCHEGVFLLV